MSIEKKYISFYVDSNKKILPRLLNQLSLLGFCKREDINIIKDLDNDEVEEKLIFEDSGIKFKMSQLLQILRASVRLEDAIPEVSEIIYKKEDVYLKIRLEFDRELLGNILYNEIRLNDVFDILDNAGIEIKDFVQKQINEHREKHYISE